MNWDALGAVAESVGAVAVVLTILYLAVQLRNSNRISKSQVYQERNTAGREMLKWMSEPHIVAPVVKLQELAKDLPEEKIHEHLTRDEAITLRAFYRAWFQHYDNIHFQYELGLIDDETFQDRAGSTVTVFTRWFRVFGFKSKRPTFQAFLDAPHDSSMLAPKGIGRITA